MMSNLLSSAQTFLASKLFLLSLLFSVHVQIIHQNVSMFVFFHSVSLSVYKTYDLIDRERTAKHPQIQVLYILAQIFSFKHKMKGLTCHIVYRKHFRNVNVHTRDRPSLLTLPEQEKIISEL